MRIIIFVIAFLTSCMSSNSQIIIHSKTDVFIDRKTGEAYDKESFDQVFTISLEDGRVTASIPSTREKMISEIEQMGSVKDSILGVDVIRINALNTYTKKDEVFLLRQNDDGTFSLYQEILETNTRIFYSPDSRCVH